MWFDRSCKINALWYMCLNVIFVVTYPLTQSSNILIYQHSFKKLLNFEKCDILSRVHPISTVYKKNCPINISFCFIEWYRFLHSLSTALYIINASHSHKRDSSKQWKRRKMRSSQILGFTVCIQNVSILHRIKLKKYQKPHLFWNETSYIDEGRKFYLAWKVYNN